MTSPAAPGEPKNSLQTQRNSVQAPEDSKYPCYHDDTEFLSLFHLRRVPEMFIFNILSWSEITPVCPCAVRHGPESVRAEGLTLGLFPLLQCLRCRVCLSSTLHVLEVSAGAVYVLLMPWKPQKFQRFSKLAPTPVSSCLKVQGSRERRASTSLGLICTQTGTQTQLRIDPVHCR